MRRPRALRAGAFALAGALALTGTVAAGCAGASAPGARSVAPHLLGPGDHTVNLVSGGRTRTMIVHVPPGGAKGTKPLILVYHGAYETASGTESHTDFVSAADAAGDVVVFLQGYGDSWNSGVGRTPAADAHVDDVAFTKAAIAKLGTIVAFNHARVAAAGFSNGALLVELLGCRLSGLLALIAPVEGPLPVNTSKACKPARALGVYEIHGTSDTAIPYNGGWFHSVYGDQVDVLSAPKSAQRWATLDACVKTPHTRQLSASVKLTTYYRCHRSVYVTLRTIYGGVHSWASNTGALVVAAIPK